MGIVDRHPWLRTRWFAGILYAICILIVLYPVSLSPFSMIVGHEQATAGCHVWVLWWAQQGLLDIQPKAPLPTVRQGRARPVLAEQTPGK